jgi:mRNA interferase RelE/StbE
VAAYSIDIRPRARRSLSQLDPAVRKAVAQTIDALSANPRRIRSGDYRVIYAVDDQERVVTVAAVGHRREI